MACSVDDGSSVRTARQWIPPRPVLAVADDCRVRFAVVPRLLGDGADATGSWIITSALPGQMAVTSRWKAQPHIAVTAIGQGLRALHDALPVRRYPFSRPWLGNPPA
jgi:hypothetical protein